MNKKKEREIMSVKAIIRFFSLVLCSFFFWRETIAWIANKIDVPGITVFVSLKTTYRITIQKLLDIYGFYFEKLGAWFYTPDFIYFFLLSFLICLVIYCLWPKWYLWLLAGLAVFFPQLISLILFYKIVSLNKQQKLKLKTLEYEI